MSSHTFTAALFKWEGDSAWHFIALPAAVADAIEAVAGGGAGFGSVRVEVVIGGSTWRTSLFPDRARATYLLPVKKQVRTAEGLVDGSAVSVSLTLVD